MIRKISLLFFTILFIVFFLSCTNDILIENNNEQPYNLKIRIESAFRSISPVTIKDLSITVKDFTANKIINEITWGQGQTNQTINLNIEYNKKYTVTVVHTGTNISRTLESSSASVDIELPEGKGALITITPGDVPGLSVTYFSMGDTPAGFTLVWQEDFNTLDTNIWNIQTGWGVNGWGNSELQCYTDRPDNLYIEDGNLVIKAIKENYVDEHGTTRSFTSGRINTMNKVSFMYGKIRARIKLPYGKGIWPAFWMLGDSFPDIGWPRCGEIDIMEIKAGDPGDPKNNTLYGALHWGTVSHVADHSGTYVNSSPFYQDYYIFELEWEAGRIYMRVASTEEELNIKNHYLIFDNIYPFKDQYFHLLLNVAVGGKFPEIYTASGITTYMPQKMYVDWIKVYQKPGSGIKVPIDYAMSFKNVKDGARVHTGFILGDVIDNGSLEQVEVQVDNGSFAPAEGTASWKFKLPTGVNTWKRGSKHTIGIRSKYTGNVYSKIMTITVIKGRNKDVNGDGYGDIAIGSKNGSINGSLKIFHGGASGITDCNENAANTTITGEESGFPTAFQMRDINRDGFADVIVADSQYNNKTGRVYIYYGSSNGITSSASAIITGEGQNDEFGKSVSMGDMNGDGQTDIVVGAFRKDNIQNGAIYIFHNNITGNIFASSANKILRSINNNFGTTVDVGDINKDGFDDIAVRGDWMNTGRWGSVYIFHGSSTGITQTDIESADSIITCYYGYFYNNFGILTILDDINNDGYLDLIAGADYYGHSGYGNKIFVYPGNNGGISSTIADTPNIDHLVWNPDAGDNLPEYKMSAALGDINGDGYPDLAIGTSSHNNYQGRVCIYNGNGSGFNSSPSTTLIGSTADGQFGLAVSLGDINGDGMADLAITEKQHITESSVKLFYGRTQNIPDGNSSTADATIQGVNNMNFGILIDH